MAQILRVDGTITEAEPANGTDFTLAELYAYVGGYVSILPLKERIMVLHRDAHLVHMGGNAAATRELVKVHGSIGRIFGTALVCAQEEVK